MARKPKIIVSSVDLERLEALLDEFEDKGIPGLSLLRAELLRADVREPQDIPKKTVTMNSSVSFKMHADDQAAEETFELTLVYPRDVNGDPGRISVFAPIGSALLGLSVGQKIDWALAGGKSVQVEIMKVTYQPEREGIFHR